MMADIEVFCTQKEIQQGVFNIDIEPLEYGKYTISIYRRVKQLTLFTMSKYCVGRFHLFVTKCKKCGSKKAVFLMLRRCQNCGAE